MIPQAGQGFRCVGHDDHLGDGTRRVRQSVSNDRIIEDAVAVKKNGASHRTTDAFSTPSHLVCRAFRRGCETRRCQMIAWKASACGVTASGLTVGMMQTASPT